MAPWPTRLVGELAQQIADLIDRAIRKHLGTAATFEQRQDLATAISGDALWFRSDRDLHGAVTTSDEVEGLRPSPLDRSDSGRIAPRL